VRAERALACAVLGQRIEACHDLVEDWVLRPCRTECRATTAGCPAGRSGPLAGRYEDLVATAGSGSGNRTSDAARTVLYAVRYVPHCAPPLEMRAPFGVRPSGQ
jgi:hypothetical protein